MNNAVFVTGIGTEVGKTVVAAILTEALSADYWKPVQSGDLNYSDTHKVRDWTAVDTVFHPEQYRLQTPMSPHAAAALDGVHIALSSFQCPSTSNFLLVEGAGGLMVPLNNDHCMIDLIAFLQMPVVLVSRHYLGSINHTLLSLEALQQRKIPVAALIFNGTPHPTTEQAITNFGLPCPLFSIPEMSEINRAQIKRIAHSLKPELEAWKAKLVTTNLHQ